jgi:hypothetical protein
MAPHVGGGGLERIPSSFCRSVGHPPFERVQVLIGDQRWGLSKFLIVDDDPQRTSKALILGPHLRDSGYDDVLQRSSKDMAGVMTPPPVWACPCSSWTAEPLTASLS